MAVGAGVGSSVGITVAVAEGSTVAVGERVIVGVSVGVLVGSANAIRSGARERSCEGLWELFSLVILGSLGSGQRHSTVKI